MANPARMDENIASFGYAGFGKAVNHMSYIWAGLILVLMALLFIITLLYLRPNLDPLILITSVLGIVGTIFSSVAAYLKSQETHLTVNSQLSAWKQEYGRMVHSEAIIEGTQVEQARIVEQKREQAITLSVPAPVIISVPAVSPAPVAPIPVTVANPPESPAITADISNSKKE